VYLCECVVGVGGSLTRGRGSNFFGGKSIKLDFGLGSRQARRLDESGGVCCIGEDLNFGLWGGHVFAGLCCVTFC